MVLEVVGPTVHLFADQVPGSVPSPFVEQVPAWRLERLREAVSPEAWASSGLASEPAVVLARFSEPLDPPAWMARATPAARRTTISAAATVSGSPGTPGDVAVLTHPGHRGRGHATEVGRAATELAVREYGIARWRADEHDRVALGVARRLGFEPWGRLLRVRLRRDAHA